jgi:hypothetical protein
MSPEAAFMDLNMQVSLPGKERTVGEFRKLFEAAGFQLKRSLPLGPRAGLVEGIKL